MILVDKCINHSIWLINAIKEHNKLVNQDITFKMTDKVFILNKSFQKYFYSFNVYQKLFAKFDKGFNFLLANNKIHKHTLINIKNTYLNRSAMHFKQAGDYLKMARNEMTIQGQVFAFIFSEMKNISSTLMNLENDLNYLINNLY